MTIPPTSYYPDIGVLGEDLVAHWLQLQGWKILHRRWRCRWGELDIVAQQESTTPFVTFVEVKTRSSGNWDAGGLLSITSQKQAKLWRTATFYLTQYPDLSVYPCRFDVALVYCQRFNTDSPPATNKPAIFESLALQMRNTKFKLLLQEYIPAAFE
ncbi:YraN family protein [Chroococcidiopsis sp. TS-821]|uniref:YraN family protein n=1 Tax=Chroococcidiopsis sp. TS-821 TaxID=1378066 RepID=UPI000CEF3E47|nr:YraN family protein [Chroococcidiopsis sp. TS-821]PPS43366.1 YraN family protein [Chroococcidiopsis sp. TS-821]